jgi:hypothetical protein
MDRSYPTPWTAFYVTDEGRFHLLDVDGGEIGAIGDGDVAKKIVRLVNSNARKTAAPILAIVASLPTESAVSAPPAPNPDDGTATTWDQLFDHLIYLLDAGDFGGLRKRLFEYARVTVGLPLPGIFTAPDDSSGDHHA